MPEYISKIFQQALILYTIIPLKYGDLLLAIHTVKQLRFFKDIKVTIKNQYWHFLLFMECYCSI